MKQAEANCHFSILLADLCTIYCKHSIFGGFTHLVRIVKLNVHHWYCIVACTIVHMHACICRYIYTHVYVHMLVVVLSYWIYFMYSLMLVMPAVEKWYSRTQLVLSLQEWWRYVHMWIHMYLYMCLEFRTIYVYIRTYIPYLSVLKSGSNTRRGSNIHREVQQNERNKRLGPFKRWVPKL